MKVIHVAESFAAGVLHFVAQMTRVMPEHEHVVIHGQRPDTPENYSGLFPQHVTLIPWQGVGRDINPWRDALALLRLIRLLHQQDGDIIHLHSSKAGFLGRLGAMLLGQSGRVLYTPHGVAFLRQDVASRKQTLFVWLEQLANRCGGQVIACSSSEAACLRSHGIEASYINNGVTCLPESDIKAPSNAEKSITVALVGRISSQKNPLWYNAIASAFANQPNIRFLWVGDGELRHQLTAPNIECTGWVSPEQVTAHLQAADIYLATSAWEGLPLSALQAMCHRLPLVLSKCTGHLDLLQPGRNGFMFQKTEEAIQAIQVLVDNPVLRAQLGQASRELLEQDFNVQQMADGYRRVYIQVGRNQQPVTHDLPAFNDFKNPMPQEDGKMLPDNPVFHP